jgi:hypothetical protein
LRHVYLQAFPWSCQIWRSFAPHYPR